MLDRRILEEIPTEPILTPIKNHRLYDHHVIRAWARGYPVVYDGICNFGPNPETLLAALENGMPLRHFTTSEWITDEHLRLCTDLKTLTIDYPSDISYCPPTVTHLKILQPCKITDLSSCISLREVRIRISGPKITLPWSVERVDVSNCDRPLDMGSCICLTQLYADENPGIRDCPSSVITLSARGSCGIADLTGCNRLETLITTGNNKILTYPESLARLEASRVGDLSGYKNLKTVVNDGPRDGMILPDSVRLLNGRPYGIAGQISEWASGVKTEFAGNLTSGNVTTPDTLLTALRNGLPLVRLKVFPGITDRHLAFCKKLQYLDASDCPQITTCPPSVTELDASGSCGIRDISECTALKVLRVVNNSTLELIPSSIEKIDMTNSSGIQNLHACESLHSIVGYDKSQDFVKLWALGYKPSFLGVVDFSVDPQIFLEALNRGMAVRKLVAGPGITDAHVSLCFGLKELVARDNPVVTRCPPSVVVLDASGNCGIKDLSKCKRLKKIEFEGNPALVKFCQKLGDDMIRECAPRDKPYVPGVVDFPINPNVLFEALRMGAVVRRLVAGPGITDKHIGLCKGLKELVARDNPAVTRCPPLVEVLDASGDCGIQDISGCVNLISLKTTGNRKIPPTVLPTKGTTFGSNIDYPVDPNELLDALRRGLVVRRLVAGPGITDAHIDLCPGLKELVARDNPAVTRCPPSVEVLDASGNCGIRDLSKCVALRILHRDGNPALKDDPPQLIIRKWAEGDTPKFSGVIDFEFDAAILERALRRGLPVFSLKATKDLRDRHIALCNDLKRLDAAGFVDITLCPPTVEELDASGNCGIHVLRHCVSLKRLNVSNNHRVTSVPDSVEEVDVSGLCGVSNLSNCTRLRKLIARDNTHIKECPPSVEILDASGFCGITKFPPGLKILNGSPVTQMETRMNEIARSIGLSAVAAWANGEKHFFNGILDFETDPGILLRALKNRLPVHTITVNTGLTDEHIELCSELKVLNARNNPFITKCPKSVTELDARDACGIFDVSMCTNLLTLDVSNNPALKLCSRSVVTLTARGKCGITDLSNCHALKNLDAANNPDLKECTRTIETLDVSGNSDFSDLRGYNWLVKLVAVDNSKITWCPRSVTILNASGTCGISNLSQLESLIYLNAANNPRITWCPPSVRELNASGSCGIRDLKDCPCIELLTSEGNPHLTTKDNDWIIGDEDGDFDELDEY